MKKGYILLLLVLMLMPVRAIARRDNTDSLRIVIKNHKNDTQKVSLLRALAYSYSKINVDSAIRTAKDAHNLAATLSNPYSEAKAVSGIGYIFIQVEHYDSAIAYYQLAVQKSRKLNDLINMAEAYRGICWSYYRTHRYDKALLYSDSSMHLYQLLKNQQGLVNIYINKSEIYQALNKNALTLDYLLLAQKLLEQLDMPKQTLKCYESLGELYTSIEDLDKALEYFNKCLDLCNKIGDANIASAIYNNIGVIYLARNDYVTARKYFTAYFESVFIHTVTGDNAYYSNVGETYFYTGDYDKAESFYAKSLTASIGINDTQNLSSAYIHLGRVQIRQKGKEDTGIANLKIGLDMAEKLKNFRYAAMSLENLISIYKQRKAYKTALEYTETYYRYMDSVGTMDLSKRLQQVEFSYEISKKEAMIKDLEKSRLVQQKKAVIRNLIILGLAGGLLGLVLFSVLVMKKNKVISRQKEIIHKHADEMDELNEFKDKILSILSHDLRNPLASLDVIVNNMHHLDIEDLPFFKNDISRQLNSINLLLENILQWASGYLKETVVPRHLSIPQLVQINIDLFESAANSKEITIINNTDATSWAIADYNHINAIIRNLLANALKFTRPGGTITLSSIQKTATVDISIADTGIGMSDEQLGKLFTKQVQSTFGTGKEKGIGLGLILCKELVEMNGGSISVTSRVNTGSIFTITLPAPNE